MAIFHMDHRFVRRSTGGSALVTAAYNAGQKLTDSNGTCHTSDFADKEGVLYTTLSVPSGSPSWAHDRGEFWRRVEVREDRSTCRQRALLAHNFHFTLHHELTLEQNIILVRDYVYEHFTRRGFAADWAIHAPDPRGDQRNIHVHILVPLRKIEGESFGNKTRFTRKRLREDVLAWRKSWADMSNGHLSRYGHKIQIDARSLRARGLKRTKHHKPSWRPRLSRAALNQLRAQQPALPVAPLVRSIQNKTAGGLALRLVIGNSELIKLAVKGREKPVCPSAERMDWPEEALAAWEAWGHKNTHLFHRIWSHAAPPRPKPVEGVTYD